MKIQVNEKKNASLKKHFALMGADFVQCCRELRKSRGATTNRSVNFEKQIGAP